VPQIRVLNKCDLTTLPPGVERDACGTISSVRTSASTGAGCADLRAALAERFPRVAAGYNIPNQDPTPALPG
jgi:50S ribosomal subunit-associated GTPase HflX